jgi:hypothetical protein
MAKIRKVLIGQTMEYRFLCPGCECEHAFNERWQFNQDFDNPTVSPSYLIYGSIGNRHNVRCHSFIENGRIRYLGDCTHALAGQTVELPDY